MLEASHRICCRHLFNNFKAKFPGMALKKQFWIAARAYNQIEFDREMNAIKDFLQGCLFVHGKAKLLMVGFGVTT